MRVVPDTNVVISGLLWLGTPRHVLAAAHAGRVTLFTTSALLLELQDVLNRPRFAHRLAQAATSASTLVAGYAALAVLVQPANIPPVILADPDDDAVLACAVAAQAEAITSGDAHLLGLGQYQGIPILTPARLLAAVP